MNNDTANTVMLLQSFTEKSIKHTIPRLPRSSRVAQRRICSDVNVVLLTKLNQFAVAQERMSFNLIVQTNHSRVEKNVFNPTLWVLLGFGNKTRF